MVNTIAGINVFNILYESSQKNITWWNNAKVVTVPAIQIVVTKMPCLAGFLMTNMQPTPKGISTAPNQLIQNHWIGSPPVFLIWTPGKNRYSTLNCISHLLNQFPYEDIPYDKPELLDRQSGDNYQAPQYEYNFVPEKF